MKDKQNHHQLICRILWGFFPAEVKALIPVVKGTARQGGNGCGCCLESLHTELYEAGPCCNIALGRSSVSSKAV